MATYAEKLRDPRWQKKRLKILERDDFSCVYCGEKKKELHVHHCAYAGRDPWNAPDSVLITLCANCHGLRQELDNNAHLLLGKILARLPNDDLNNFVIEMAPVCENEDVYPALVDSFKTDWDSDTRWFNYAWNNPVFRPAYEAITGRNPKWGEPNK